MTKKIYFLLMVWGLDALHFFHFDPMKYASIFPLWGVTYFFAVRQFVRNAWRGVRGVQHFRTWACERLSRLARFQVIAATRGRFLHAKLD